LKAFIILYIIFLSILSNAQDNVYDIFNKSYSKIKNAKTLFYYNYATEKIGTKYIIDKSLIKVNRNPFKVYIFQKKEGGSEILYNSSINTEKAFVNPSKFPYITLHLSPYGSIMRNETHHTIFQADIKYTYDILNNTIVNNRGYSLLRLLGKVKIDNKILYKIELDNKNYKNYRYTIKQGESITSIAKSKRLGAYKILVLNPNISFYDDVKTGDIITIPNYYSKKVYLYIDIKTYLPYLIKVYDTKELYESYKFEKLIINYQFNKDEFSENYKDYNF